MGGHLIYLMAKAAIINMNKFYNESSFKQLYVHICNRPKFYDYYIY